MKENNKQQLIIKAAEKRFIRHGIKKTTIDEIARDLRIAKGGIYHYFKSKEDIYYNTLVNQHTQFLSQLKGLETTDVYEIISKYLNDKSIYKENFPLLYQLYVNTYNNFLLPEEQSAITIMLNNELTFFSELFKKNKIKNRDID